MSDIDPAARLRDAILKAAEHAGDKGGIIAYLEKHAATNPTAAALLARVLASHPRWDLEDYL